MHALKTAVLVSPVVTRDAAVQLEVWRRREAAVQLERWQ